MPKLHTHTYNIDKQQKYNKHRNILILHTEYAHNYLYKKLRKSSYCFADSILFHYYSVLV